MKKFLAVCAVIASLTACDKIKNPVQSPVSGGSAPATTEKRKVLLEDYTGHTCGNCPAAAEVAENLQKKNESQLVVVAVHAGFFSKTNGLYPASYTTAASVEWDKTFIGTAGNPNGMVNRKNYQNNGLVTNQSKWPTTTNLAMADTNFVKLTLVPAYDAATRMLSVDVTAKFLQNYRNKTSITLVLIEDSVIGPQTDYRVSPDMVSNYVFMHMLRVEINGTWGTSLKPTAALKNDEIKKTFSSFAVNTAFVDKHLSLVGFISDEITREVIQVEKVPLIPSAASD